MKKMLCICSLMILSTVSFSQNAFYSFERLSEKNGLNEKIVNSIFQDKKGFIWIGGQNGLHRYDGYNFKNYKQVPGCVDCPEFHSLYKIAEDKFGVIWTISDKAIIAFDPKTETSKMVYKFGTDTSTLIGIQWKLDLIVDSEGIIWATIDKGLLKITYKTSKEPDFFNPDKEFIQKERILLNSSNYSWQNWGVKLFEDKQHHLWVGTCDGLFTRRKEGFVKIKVPGIPDRTMFYDIMDETEDTLWVLTSAGRFKLSNIKNVFISNEYSDIRLFPLNLNRQILNLYKGNDNHMLLGSSRDVYEKKGNNISGGANLDSFYYRMMRQDEYKLPKFVTCIFKDNTGLIWTGHNFSGILKFKNNFSVFKSYSSIFPSSFENFSFNAICKDDEENTWIGINPKGLYKLDKKGMLNHYVINENKHTILCIERMTDKALLIGFTDGLAEFNTDNGKYRDPVPNSETAENLRNAQVLKFLKYGESYFIATSNGLFMWDVPAKQLYQYAFNRNRSFEDGRNLISSLVKTSNGEIWAYSPSYGIKKVQYQKGKSFKLVDINLTFPGNKKFEFAQQASLFCASDKNVWVADQNGLYKIDPLTCELQKINLGYYSNNLDATSITEDNFQNLWMGTENGLFKFSMKTGEYKFFSTEDGIPLFYHACNAVFKDKHNRITFGGLGAMYSFNPDSIVINRKVPAITITDIKLFNRSLSPENKKGAVLVKNIAYTDRVELKHNQNDLTLVFAAMDYNQPFKNKYAYKLEGYQKDWVETDAFSRFASYTNLHPGKYVFRVKGSNSDGTWNNKGTSLMIMIHKPWWSTIFAWFFYFFTAGSTITLFIKWRLKRITKEKKQLEKIVNERTLQLEDQKEEIISQRNLLAQQNREICELNEIKDKFFANISHEFRTPLTLIQNPVDDLLRNSKLIEKDRSKLNMVSRNVTKLLSLVDQLLDISKIDNSCLKLELVHDDLMKYLEHLTDSFCSLAETKNISYKCFFYKHKEEMLSWFDPDKVQKIVDNLLSNAFKFTPEGGEITFSASYNFMEENEPFHVVFCVEDTGKGIPQNELEKIFDRFYRVEESVKNSNGGVGIGLSIVRDLVQLQHGQIKVESEPAKGSKFTVSLNLGLDHLSSSEYSIYKRDLFKPAHSFLEVIENDHLEIQSWSQHQNNPTILIVEDNHDIRKQLFHRLCKIYNVEQAFDGISGLKKAKELIPDLIITDLMMPYMNGIELCSNIKTDINTSHIPIIILTAKVAISDKVKGLTTGADDYISKPFNMEELILRVSNLLNQRQKLRERFRKEIVLAPSHIAVTSTDERFLKQAIEIVEIKMKDEKFDLVEFRLLMNMSRSTLFRKITALTGQSPTEFIRSIRLKRAANLLQQRYGNITQIAMEVGFNNLSYFNKSFKKLFGLSPVAYEKKFQLQMQPEFQSEKNISSYT